MDTGNFIKTLIEHVQFLFDQTETQLQRQIENIVKTMEANDHIKTYNYDEYVIRKKFISSYLYTLSSFVNGEYGDRTFAEVNSDWFHTKLTAKHPMGLEDKQKNQWYEIKIDIVEELKKINRSIKVSNEE